MNSIFVWSEGNPGAASFLVEATKSENSEKIFAKLNRCPSIRGTSLYVLYSDLCGKDMDAVLQLCESCPNDVLEDACSRIGS